MRSRRVVWFFIIFILLLFITSGLVSPYGGEVYDIKSTNQRIEDIRVEKDNTIDVLFAGNSLVFRDLSPLQMWGLEGITSYDLSDGAMRLCDQYTLIQNACITQKPELIVLETCVFFTDASPYKDDFALPTNLIEKIFPIFHYHTFYKGLSVSDPDIDARRLLKGFDPSFDTKPYTGDPDYMADRGEVTDIPELNRRYLEDIMAFCKENDIKVMLIALPSPVNYDMSKHNSIAGWAKERDIEFVDLNLLTDELGIDWNTDTKDEGDHLNFEGSKKVSSYIAEHITKGYGLSDHRGDPEYAQWEESYEEAGLY
ncbi:MAG: hypothetical protein K6G42_04640 [Lachnospiraceae bacterium]|nr:hypothetical protein [Lachnospiraceae bacterium]